MHRSADRKYDIVPWNIKNWTNLVIFWTVNLMKCSVQRSGVTLLFVLQITWWKTEYELDPSWSTRASCVFVFILLFCCHIKHVVMVFFSISIVNGKELAQKWPKKSIMWNGKDDISDNVIKSCKRWGDFKWNSFTRYIK